MKPVGKQPRFQEHGTPRDVRKRSLLFEDMLPLEYFANLG